MNAYTYDSSPAACPICNHTVSLSKPINMVSGLLTCPQCRARLVMSRSGHFVRDPFAGRRSPTGQKLRRQSRPLARILRDAGITRHPSLVTMIGSLFLIGLTLLAFGGAASQQLPLPEKVEQIIKLGEVPRK